MLSNLVRRSHLQQGLTEQFGPIHHLLFSSVNTLEQSTSFTAASILPLNRAAERNSRRRRISIGAALIAGILLQFLVAWAVRKQVALGFSDFSNFYTAGKIVASGNGSHLYDIATQARVEGSFTVRSTPESFLPYVHPPFFALIFAPLSALPYPVAFYVWWVCNVCLAYLCLFLLCPYLPRLNSYIPFAIVGTGIFYPLLVAETQGQDSILSLLLFTVCFVNLTRGRAWTAGCALAFAAYKPELALLAMTILAVSDERRWRILSGFVPTCILLALASVATSGWSVLTIYPRFLTKFASEFDEARFHIGTMPNLRGLIYSTLGPQLSHQALSRVIQAASIVVVAVALWVLKSKTSSVQESHLRYAVAVTATMLVAYYGFFHDMTLLLLPLFLAWNSLIESGLGTWNRKLLAVCVAAFFLAPILSIFSPPFYAAASVVCFVSLCLELKAVRNMTLVLNTPRASV